MYIQKIYSNENNITDIHQKYSNELLNGLKWAIFSKVHIIIIFWWIPIFPPNMYIKELSN
jgi:hypothetical protein